MRKSNTVTRIFTFALFMLATVVMPEMASAKWSKASAKFSYDKVSVEVVDRHQWVGKMLADTYGYTIFTNGNDEAVNIDWKCYGVLPGGKLVKVDEGDFVLSKKQTRKEVYSYGAGRFDENDFDKYVVAIQVTKEKAETPTAPTPAVPAAPVGGVTKSNADKVYSSLERKMNSNSFTQEDYSQAIDWLYFTFDTDMKPVYEQCIDLAMSGNEAAAERLTNSVMALGQKWTKLADYVTAADETNKLNSANHAKFERLKNHVTSVIQ